MDDLEKLEKVLSAYMLEVVREPFKKIVIILACKLLETLEVLPG